MTACFETARVLPETSVADSDVVPASDTPFPSNPSDAECLFEAAKLLPPTLEAGQSLDTASIRAAMEDAYGASDGDGT